MTKFRFENIEMLWLLCIVPVLFGIMILAILAKQKKIERYGDAALMDELMPLYSPARQIFKQIIIITAVTLLIFALARPQFGTKLQKVNRRGVELVLALDVSNSMMAEDITPNRLERAKNAISKLVDKLDQDKIGLIVFAGDAFVQIPITTDYSAAKIFLSSINTDIVPVQGTSISEAINLAANSFGPDQDIGKALVIITDGEDHEGEAITAAESAKEKGIIVHTIGIGTPKGVPVPIYDAYGNKTYRKDKEGNPVVSKLNVKMLSEIADVGGGTYRSGTNLQSALNQIFDEITKMNKKEYEAVNYADYKERYYILAIAAFILLVFEFFFMERKNKYFKNVNLFNR